MFHLVDPKPRSQQWLTTRHHPGIDCILALCICTVTRLRSLLRLIYTWSRYRKGKYTLHGTNVILGHQSPDGRQKPQGSGNRPLPHTVW